MAHFLPSLGQVLVFYQTVLLGFLVSAGSGVASGLTNSPADRAERQYLLARALYANDSRTNLQSAWQFSQACFEWAEYARDNTQRAELATEGIAAARAAIREDSRLGPAVYYLALNLGQLARTKTVGALRLVSEMETLLKKCVELEPTVDFAGAHRSLGLLYRDAPGWPLSIGSKSKARQHLLKAVELRPDFPENHLCLLESYLEWGDKRAVKSRLKEVQDVLNAARKKYGGETWEASWQDWDRRWEALWDRIYPD